MESAELCKDVDESVAEHFPKMRGRYRPIGNGVNQPPGSLHQSDTQ